MTARLNALLLRSHQKTPLDCWREVDAFKSAVAMEEQVSFRRLFGLCGLERRLSHVCRNMLVHYDNRQSSRPTY